MDYKAVLLNHDEIKKVVNTLESETRALMPGGGRDEGRLEQMLKMISILAKLEKTLKFNEEEVISVYVEQMLRQGGQENCAMEALAARIELLQALCDEFEGKNRIDIEFYDLYKTILNMGYDSLYKQMVENFTKYYASETENANNLLRSYNRTLYWGALDYWAADYELIKNRAESLINNADSMLWMYLALEDYTSKEVMYHVLHNWVTFSHQTLHEMPRNQYAQYFDYDIIGGSGGDVFIDAGALFGDTVDSFAANFSHYTKIYSYEITPSTFEKLKENMTKYKNVVCRHCGVANKEGTMFMNECEDIGGNRLGDKGNIEVPVVTLDGDVKEKIDFIKMDIEGGEYDALIGAREHIINEHPKLAIAAYHNNVDIFRLARLISELDSGYRFYYRYYGGTLYPNDYVLYAV